MRLTKTFFPNSAIFIEKKSVETRLWETVHFCGGKKMCHCDQRGASRGTGQSWLGQQCCQEAPHNGYSEERAGVRQWWRSWHKSTYVGH